MRWPSVLVGVGLALLSIWTMLGTESPGAASNVSTLYVPLVMKQGWIEPVSIVQHDRRQAVYWSTPLPQPGYYYPSPTPVPGIPIYLEVKNYTDRDIAGVNVEFRALDSQGDLITSIITSTATLLNVLAPGQTSPVAFSIPFPGGYSAFQAATKQFTVLPDWSYTDWNGQTDLEIGWGYPGYGPPGVPTPVAPTPAPPNISGWVKNNGSSPAMLDSVVIAIRGNDQASGLVLEAARVPIDTIVYPGSIRSFYAYFGRDYGPLFGTVEATAQRRADIPGILSADSW